MKRPLILFAIGLAYGLLLACLGLAAAGGGEGAMAPIYVFGSPFAIPFLFLAPVVLWPFVGLFLGESRSIGYRRAFLALMFLHYAGITPYLLIFNDEGRSYRMWEGAPDQVIILLMAYMIGQVGIWTYYFRLQMKDGYGQSL